MCSQRANAAVLSHEHVCLRTEIDASVLTAWQSFRRNMSLCAWREIQVCLWRSSAAVLSHEHPSVPCARMEIQVAGISRVLAQQLP